MDTANTSMDTNGMPDACIVTGGTISRVVVEPRLSGITQRGRKKDIEMLSETKKIKKQNLHYKSQDTQHETQKTPQLTHPILAGKDWGKCTNTSRTTK